MRDAADYEDRAVNCMLAIVSDDASHAELFAQLEAMSTDDVRALMDHADGLRLHARREWLHRTTRPADG